MIFNSNTTFDNNSMYGDIGHKINWSRMDIINFKTDNLWKRVIEIYPPADLRNDLPSTIDIL